MYPLNPFCLIAIRDDPVRRFLKTRMSLYSKVMVANTQIADPLAQVLSHRLALCPGWRHSVHESLYIIGEIQVSVLGESIGDRTPSAFDGLPCLFEFALAGLDSVIAFQQFGGESFGLGADVGGIAAKARAINPVLLGFPGFTTDSAFGGIGINAEQP